jgi:transposase
LTGRIYTVEEKYNIVMESLATDQSIAQICRKFGINVNTYQRWKEQFLQGARNGLEGKSRRNPYEQQMDDMKGVIAELTMANESLKKIQQGRRR